MKAVHYTTTQCVTKEKAERDRLRSENAELEEGLLASRLDTQRACEDKMKLRKEVVELEAQIQQLAAKGQAIEQAVKEAAAIETVKIKQEVTTIKVEKVEKESEVQSLTVEKSNYENQIKSLSYNDTTNDEDVKWLRGQLSKSRDGEKKLREEIDLNRNTY